MKILIVSQYFWPENFRINDLATSLQKEGHQIVVLTGKPNYPQGKIYNGYKFFGYTKDSYQGIPIIRVPLIPRGKGGGVRLILNYLSFVFFGCLYFLFNKQKYDVSLTFAISPITSVYPALLHKTLYKSKAILWVQDLWPESISAAGKIHSQILMKGLTRMVKHIYRHTDKILIQSEAFQKSIEEKGVEQKKIFYVPNWAEDLFQVKNTANFSKYKKLIPEGFVIMFAGNLGEAQDFDSIIQAVSLTKKYNQIKWVFIGDGRNKIEIETNIKKVGLENNCFLLGSYPLSEMPHFFIHADLMLVTLKDEYIFSLTIPSKIQSYMAFGKPIASMINGITNDVILAAGCGYTANAGNYHKLAENIITAYQEDPHILETKGMNGKKYYEQNFSKQTILKSLINIFNN